MITDREENTIGKLYDFLKANPNAILDVEFGFESFKAIKDGCYETDNGLEMDEEGYEEYHAILVRRADTGKLFEITYKNFPSRISANGSVIFECSVPHDGR